MDDMMAVDWVPDLLSDEEVAALLTHFGAHPDGDPRDRVRDVLARHGQAGGPTILPLSWNQTSVWYLHELNPMSAAYHVGGGMQIRDGIDVPAFEQAVQGVVDRHEALRTTVVTMGGRPFQLVHATMPTPVVHVDATAMSREELVGRVQRDYESPMDLRTGPGLQVVLYDREGPPVLLVRIHHALMDLWSLALVFYDLGQAYAAIREGRAMAELRPPGAQYSQFVRWQREVLRGDVGREQEQFWLKQLGGMPHALELAPDHPRLPTQSMRGHAVRIRFDEDLTREIARFGRSQGATTMVVLLAAFQLLLHRVTGQRDFGVGVPLAGRSEADFRDMVGHCVNMGVLRVWFGDDPTFNQLLDQVRRNVRDAARNEDFPFAQLVNRLGVAPEQSRPPLFQTSLVYQQSPLIDMNPLVFDTASRRPVDIGGMVLEPFPMWAQQGQFELSLWAGKVDRCLHGELKLDAALFDLDTGHRLGRYLETLLRGAIESPDTPVSQLPLMDPGEVHRIIHDWNDTRRPYRDDVRLETLFAEQTARTPDALAVTSADRGYTYAELAERANRLAHHLFSLGTGPGDLVGVMMDRSPDMIVALLGILGCGAGYVPLEAHYPAARIAFILDSLDISVVVTEGEREDLLERLGTESPRALVLLDRDDLSHHSSMAPTRTGHSPDDTAYVIFTSGSTGTPKGVFVRHPPVVNIIDWVNRTYQVGPDDRLLFITSLSFDLSVYDIFGALAAGATIRIAAREEIQDPYRLVSLLVEDGITIWDSAPPALNQLVPFLPPTAPESALRLVMLSGDWIPVRMPDQIRQVFPDAHVVSFGGATEATIWSNYYDIGEVDPSWPSIPYGRPVQNARYYILDQAGQPVPVGVPGDLYIGGPVLADGYINDPEQTAAKFVPDPFVDDPDARMYDTGDRARFFPDGTMEFLGRRDFQVKIRGFRIELGEIEAALAEHPAVADCIVLARDDEGDRYLTAYVVPRDGQDISGAVLRPHLQDRLPEFMVPPFTVVMDALPLTPNGKVDRKVLPAPERRREDLGTAFVEPATDRERELADIWCRVLGIDRVGATDSFFDLGGDSLRAVQVVFEIERRTGIALPISTLVRAPTLGALAQQLDAAPDGSLVVSLRDGDDEPGLFLFHPSGGELVAYRTMVESVAPGRTLHGVRSASRAGGTDPGTVAAMAQRYAELVRSVQPEGPYLLAGWSLGGVLAHAVAAALEQDGASVAACAVIDSVVPHGRPDLLDRTMYRLGSVLGPLSGSLATVPDAQLTELLALPEDKRRDEALRLARQAGADVADWPRDMLEREVAIAHAHSTALALHEPPQVSTPVAVLWAEQSTDHGTPLTDWGAHTRGGVEQQVVAGANHYTLWQPPHIDELLAWLNGVIQKALARC